ncbi:MAG: hypothetical protein D6675_02800 [Gemmatimonadetes bacterium]|nr:MAG: hypothetical protein D6675_02800 [Gemmatimonadota bacterium]
MLRRIALYLIVLAGFWITGVKVAYPQPVEDRGLWVVRNTLTSPTAIDDLIYWAVNANFNSLFVQVCGRGDAYYRSELLPPAEPFLDNPPSYDPFAYLVQQAHRYGLEVHAWINVFYIWSAANPPRSARHIYYRHPDWIMTDQDGRSMRDYTHTERRQKGVEGIFISPGIPQVRNHLREIVNEILEQYPVDGIHLDYVRYPGASYSFDFVTRHRFERKAKVDPYALLNNQLTFPSTEEFLAKVNEWNQWRADQITRLVRALHYDISRKRPQVKLSAAVIADVERAYYRFGQKWADWLAEGILDFAVPMAYTTNMADFETYVRDAVALAGDRPVYVGIGVWNKPFEDALLQIQKCRAEGVQGVVLFSHNALTQRPEWYLALRQGAFRERTLRPEMPWKGVPEIAIENEMEWKIPPLQWLIPNLVLD